MKIVPFFIKMVVAFSLAFTAAVFGGSLMVSWYFRTLALEKFTTSETLVEIPYGSSLRRITAMLDDAGIIKSPRKFYWYLRLGRNDGDKMQAGFYRFAGDHSYQDVANRLLWGQDQSYRITFREGQTLADLARILEGASLTTQEAFISAITSDEIKRLIDAPMASGIEGYLFPDTYFFAKSDTAVSIIKKMHQRLMSMWWQEMPTPMAGFKDHMHNILTLASIIEKESADRSEMPIIASVYRNRLKIRMRLQADPTVIYGIKDYDGNIKKSDLLRSHPYNTYTIAGLPPGPIASPGFAAIRAAVHPANTKYLYFVSRNDGTHEFCENLSCHNKAVKKWQIDYFKNPPVR